MGHQAGAAGQPRAVSFPKIRTGPERGRFFCAEIKQAVLKFSQNSLLFFYFQIIQRKIQRHLNQFVSASSDCFQTFQGVICKADGDNGGLTHGRFSYGEEIEKIIPIVLLILGVVIYGGHRYVESVYQENYPIYVQRLTESAFRRGVLKVKVNISVHTVEYRTTPTLSNFDIKYWDVVLMEK